MKNPVGKTFREKATQMSWTCQAEDLNGDPGVDYKLVNYKGLTIYIGAQELEREFEEVKP